eukprot:scaffold419_cov51-Isochrysis_galbana.AAC.1
MAEGDSSTTRAPQQHPKLDVGCALLPLHPHKCKRRVTKASAASQRQAPRHKGKRRVTKASAASQRQAPPHKGKRRLTKASATVER